MTRTPTTRDPNWTHLPPRPWAYIGGSTKTYQACHGAPIQPGAACDHCGTGIIEVHTFRGADGRLFEVGSTCVEKMFREMRTKSLSAAMRKIKNERNAKARARAKIKRTADKADAELLTTTKRDAASRLPHPAQWAADQGKTLADWAEWMLRFGGGPAAKQVIQKLSSL